MVESLRTAENGGRESLERFHLRFACRRVVWPIRDVIEAVDDAKN